MSPEDYSEFLVSDLTPLSEEVKAASEGGPADPSLGLPFSRRDEILKVDPLPLETGFARLPDGMLYVAVRHDLPGVTVEMIKWWFGWHNTDERYRLWHPADHKAARWKSPPPPKAEGEAAYLGRTSLVDESINGGQVQSLAIGFRRPEDFFSPGRWAQYIEGQGTDGRGERAAICGRVGRVRPPVDAGHVVHLVCESDEGSIMRSRFWLGDLVPRGLFAPLAALVNRPANRRRVFSLEDGRDLLIHCAQEMNHFPLFLPRLYGRFRNGN